MIDPVRAVVAHLRGNNIQAYGGLELPEGVMKNPHPSGVVLVSATGGSPERGNLSADTAAVTVTAYGVSFEACYTLYDAVWEAMRTLRKRTIAGVRVVSCVKVLGPAMVYDEVSRWRQVSATWLVTTTNL